MTALSPESEALLAAFIQNERDEYGLVIGHVLQADPVPFLAAIEAAAEQRGRDAATALHMRHEDVARDRIRELEAEAARWTVERIAAAIHGGCEADWDRRMEREMEMARNGVPGYPSFDFTLHAADAHRETAERILAAMRGDPE